MKNVINKFINVVHRLANNQDLRPFDISEKENVKISLLERIFSFLICQNKNFSKLKEEDFKNLFLSNKILTGVQFNLDKNFKKEEDLNRKDTIYSTNNAFVEKECFLYTYHVLKNNKNFCFGYSIPLVLDKPITKSNTLELSVPVVFSGENEKEILNAPSFKEKDGYVRVAAIDLLKYAKNKFILKNKMLMHNAKFVGVKFVKREDGLVLKAYIEDELSRRAEKEAKMEFLNSNGKIDMKNTSNYALILNSLRNSIAHSKTMFYNYDANNNGTIMFFKSGKNKKSAINIPYVFGKSLAGLFLGLFDEGEEKAKYLYYPKLEKPIRNKKELEEFLSKCKIIELNNFDNFNKHELNVLVKYSVDKFNDSNEKGGFKEYLENIFKTIQQSQIKVKIEKLENLTIILDKLDKNLRFYANPNTYEKEIKSVVEKQIDYIKEMFETYYGFDMVGTKSVSKGGKYTKLNINMIGISLILDNVMFAIKNFIENKKQTKLAIYKEEMLIMLAIFLSYILLIANGFEEDIDKKETSLNEKEFSELQQKLNELNMNNFSMVDNLANSKTSQRSPKTIEEKTEVIKTIRNTIAHKAIKLKFNNNGDINDTLLIFGYEGFKNKYNSISLGNLLKFLSNPLLLNYNTKRFNFVEFNNEEELIEFVKTKL